jgi:hypothetical protein
MILFYRLNLLNYIVSVGQQVATNNYSYKNPNITERVTDPK